jgi:LysR family transcriptional regulator, nitrogen assimilation regulatory protein
MSVWTLNALRTVAAVARSGSLSRAAAALGIAQSAASRHLAEVEAALGAPLFHRTGRGVTPTELAHEALPRLQALLADADGLTQALRERAGAPGGPVTLGLVPSLAGPLASALWTALAAEHPQLQLRLREGYSGDLEAALADGHVDLAVLNRYRAQGPNRYRSLFEAPLCLVGRPAVLAAALAQPGQPLPATTRVAALAGLHLVMPVPPNALCSLLDEQAHRVGVSLRVMVAAGSSVIIKRLLADHDCASVLPRHAVADELARGQLAAVPMAERALRQQVVLATSSQRPFTLAARTVAGLIPALVKAVVQP